MSVFFANIPIWVFPLFILLIILGFRASRDRAVPLLIIYLLPLLGLLTINALIALSPSILGWSIAAIAYGIGAILGMKWQKNWTMHRGTRFIDVKGEWVTMAAMMIIFSANFANGAISALLPEMAQSFLFVAAFAILTGVPSGQFLGRAIKIARTPATQET